MADLPDIAARIEVQAEIVDRRLTRPSRWTGPSSVGRLRGAEADAAWERIVAAYNGLTSDPERVFTGDGLWRLRTQILGSDAHEPDPMPAQDRRMWAAEVALGCARRSRWPGPLTAATLELTLKRIFGFNRAWEWTARLAASAVLLRAGWRSTLVCCLADELRTETSPGGACVPRGPGWDDAAWLQVRLLAMARRTDAVARYRRRETALRAALTQQGICARRQDALLARFDRLGPGFPTTDPALRALCAVSAPWPLLGREWGDLADRLGPQLGRLRAEEEAEGLPVPLQPPLPRPRRPAASVIVPAYDDASSIAAVLSALERQDLTEPWEVIVVASGDDPTTDIVRRQFPRTVLFHSPDRLNPGAARNVGVDAARGEVIAFVAADCIPAPDWLRRRLEAHRRGHPLVGGFVDSATPSTCAGWAQYFAKYWGMQRFDQEVGTGPAPLYHLSYVRGILHGRWDETAAHGEDTAFNDVLVRAGHHVWFDAAIRVFHVNARRLRVVLREQRQQGYASGRLVAGHDLARYFRPLRGGPWMPFVLGARGLAAVAASRRRLLPRCLLVLPLTIAALAARRRGFRRGIRDGPLGVPDPLPRRRIARVALHPPEISVVVPAYNEAAVIGGCIDSLLAQTGPPAEIIVVDDGSTDRTAEIARARHVRVLPTAHRGPGAAKNAGAASASGEVLVFFDADLVAAPAALATLCAPILDGAAAGTFTADIMVANPDNGWADCWTLNRGARPGEHFPTRLPRQWDNFRAVRRDLFLQAGGFDDVGYGEDMTLAPKLGVKAEQVAGARFWHNNPSSLGEVWDNARWIGLGPVTRRRSQPPRARDLVRSFRRGVDGARRLGRPRFVLFALTYDLGVLMGYRSARRGRRRRGHAK